MIFLGIYGDQFPLYFPECVAQLPLSGNDHIVVFSNLNLYIDRGDIVSIVGNSGCGKTTLLNLIAGVLLPSKGEIKKSDKNIAYLMQDVTLLPYRTAWENTFLACELRGIPVDNIQKQAAKEILDLFNIETEALNKFPKELSGGMKQRIGLLQTLLTDASLFLLDEPFNAIDINALNSIKLYIWEYLIKSNKTMIFITHNIDQALLLSDRILIMRSPTELLEIKPTKEYCSLSPDERIDTSEYKKLFFEIVTIGCFTDCLGSICQISVRLFNHVFFPCENNNIVI